MRYYAGPAVATNAPAMIRPATCSGWTMGQAHRAFPCLQRSADAPARQQASGRARARDQQPLFGLRLIIASRILGIGGSDRMAPRCSGILLCSTGPRCAGP